MKYTKEERLDIGRWIYDGEISKYTAAEKYGISVNCARDYIRSYRDINGLPPKNLKVARAKWIPAQKNPETMEDLIQEIVKARITEARLKKDTWLREMVRTGNIFC